jgi:hypothetical protein
MFMQPDHGNTKRLGSPVNAIKNLKTKLNRQAKAREEVVLAGFK